MWRAASDSRYTASGAMASGPPASISNGTLSAMRVMATGAMQLALMPYLRRAKAALRVSDTTPPLAAE